jgi:hypothetical protein
MGQPLLAEANRQTGIAFTEATVYECPLCQNLSTRAPRGSFHLEATAKPTNAFPSFHQPSCLILFIPTEVVSCRASSPHESLW